MPIEKQISNYLALLDEERLVKPHRCQRCKRSDHLRWHGSYSRTLIAMTQLHALRIKRLFCISCRHTFVLLPKFVAKFHRYAKEVIELALHKLKTSNCETVASWFMERGFVENLAPLTIYFWRRKFS